MCENAFMKVWVASTGSIFNGGRRVFLTFLSIPPTGQTSSGVVGILLLLFCCSSSKWFACYSSVSVENDTQRQIRFFLHRGISDHGEGKRILKNYFWIMTLFFLFCCCQFVHCSVYLIITFLVWFFFKFILYICLK